MEISAEDRTRFNTRGRSRVGTGSGVAWNVSQVSIILGEWQLSVSQDTLVVQVQVSVSSHVVHRV